VYSGPIGAVLTPLLLPDDPAARELPEASSLCGACSDVCPVRIPLHDMLLRLRHRDARPDASRLRRLGFGLWSLLWSHPAGYRCSIVVGRLALRLAARAPRLASRLPGWSGAWARTRRFPEVHG
jgi:L-lactate dehydrogenase complex protein LldF